MSEKRGPVVTFRLPGEAASSARRQLHHCFFVLDAAHSQADVETEFGLVSLILILL